VLKQTDTQVTKIECGKCEAPLCNKNWFLKAKTIKGFLFIFQVNVIPKRTEELSVTNCLFSINFVQFLKCRNRSFLKKDISKKKHNLTFFSETCTMVQWFLLWKEATNHFCQLVWSWATTCANEMSSWQSFSVGSSYSTSSQTCKFRRSIQMSETNCQRPNVRN
jgi:hypothetical protein